MDCQRIGWLPREFDALDRQKMLWLLLHCIAKLPPKPKKVLALYYDEDFSLADIATGFGLTENEIDQMRAKALRVLQMMLTTQLSAALPQKGSTKTIDRSERVKRKITFPAAKNDQFVTVTNSRSSWKANKRTSSRKGSNRLLAFSQTTASNLCFGQPYQKQDRKASRIRVQVYRAARRSFSPRIY